MSQVRARILIVDDREENRYVLGRIRGSEALQAARALPDLMILDVRLPDMSGYDVCRQTTFEVFLPVGGLSTNGFHPDAA